MENIKDTEIFLFHFDLILNPDISLYLFWDGSDINFDINIDVAVSVVLDLVRRGDVIFSELFQM